VVSTNVENDSVGEIEKITGNNKILLIAPHGFNGDKTNGLKAGDENTGILTREIATRLNCYVIINKVYKKPKKANDPETKREIEIPDPKNKRINLNRQDQVEKHLKKEFLQPLKNFTQSIIKNHGSALLFWIHGIKDKNITTKVVDGDIDNTHVVLGIGQGNPDDHRTAIKKTVEDLIRVLRENGGKRTYAALAKEESKYCGAHENIMNQYFRTHGHDLSKVESIQMEIKYSGFRDEENIVETAEAFSTALSKLIEPMPLVKTETEPDIKLVERAYSTLAQIVSMHYQNAMIEAGQFIIKEFYGNDIERARNKDPICKKSLNQLIQRLHARNNGGPSKSWVYNAVNLVVQENDLAGFHTYGKLALSHKVLLLPIGSRKQKEDLIEEIAAKNLTVQGLREKIVVLKEKGTSEPERQRSLNKAITKPEILFSDDFSSAIKVQALSKYRLPTLDKLHDQAQNKIKEIEGTINELNSYLVRYQGLIGILKNIKEQKYRKKTARLAMGDRKQKFTYEGKTGIAETKGFQKKQLADFACNIGNICQFGCTFCYVPSVVTKQKNVQEILKEGYGWDEISHYRTKENLVKCVERDLKKIVPGDKRMVIFCTTCDPCASEEHADITSSAIRLIMESSDLQVRVLSKSTLILEIAKELDPYRERIIYGLSTGTIRPEISACIEENASPVQDRFKTLDFMQGTGYRTFGMLCPILPSEMPYLDKLIDAIDVRKCEHIWAEALNVRGKSLVKTRDQFKNCGLDEDAKSLDQVMGNKANWRDYSKELFLNVRNELEKRGATEKLRFLQYVIREPEEFVEFFESQKEAICL